MVDVGVGDQIEVLKSDRLLHWLPLHSQLRCVLVDRDAFEFAFAFTLAVVDDLVQVAVEHVDLLAVVVQLVGVAFSIVRFLTPPDLFRELVEHADLSIELLYLCDLNLVGRRLLMLRCY